MSITEMQKVQAQESEGGNDKDKGSGQTKSLRISFFWEK
jgi:hypothetical protein